MELFARLAVLYSERILNVRFHMRRVVRLRTHYVRAHFAPRKILMFSRFFPQDGTKFHIPN